MVEVRRITSQKEAKAIKFGEQFVVDVFPDPPTSEKELADFDKKFADAQAKRDGILYVVGKNMSSQKGTK